jgi:hypothetical protein
MRWADGHGSSMCGDAQWHPVGFRIVLRSWYAVIVMDGSPRPLVACHFTSSHRVQGLIIVLDAACAEACAATARRPRSRLGQACPVDFGAKRSRAAERLPCTGGRVSAPANPGRVSLQ